MGENNQEVIIDVETQNKIEKTYKSLPQLHIPSEIQAAINRYNKFLYSSIITPEKNISAVSIAVQAMSEKMKQISNSVMGSYVNTLKMSTNILPAINQTLDGSNRMRTIIDDLVNSIQIKLPKIELPKIDPKIYNRWKFISIASDINFPIYFEIDTELQDCILEIVTVDVSKSEERIEKIEKCIMEYYNHEVLHSIMNVWLQQSWIDQWQKEALEEAIKDYEEERYYSTGSILMCQLGGLITRLYDVAKTLQEIPKEEKKEILSLYDIRKPNSEKAKVIQMMSIQDQGILLWERSANYFVNYIYSSSGDMRKFTEDPGRNKICHGELTNYGTQKHALKAILVTDIIFQLGIEMFNKA